MTHPVTRGDRFGRWTVIRAAAPAVRSPSEGYQRRRWAVRCVCGAEAVAFEVALKKRESRGCRSLRCAIYAEASGAVSPVLHQEVSDAVDRGLTRALGVEEPR